jgi:predicted transcriptional regulator
MSIKTKHDKHLQEMYDAKMRKLAERKIARESFDGNKTTWFEDVRSALMDKVEDIKDLIQTKQVELKAKQSALMEKHADLIEKGMSKQTDLRHKASSFLHAVADKVDVASDVKA